MSALTRYLKLTTKQDVTLRDLELSPLVNAKVRLRASTILAPKPAPDGLGPHPTQRHWLECRSTRTALQSQPPKYPQ